MSLPRISPEQAKRLVEQGALLIDIREADEHARLRIEGARHEPLSRIGKLGVTPGDQVVIFHCKAGNRTQANAARLADATSCEAFILDGGIEGWKNAGLPVIEAKEQPIEMMR